jgi:hypothetical protein
LFVSKPFRVFLLIFSFTIAFGSSAAVFAQSKSTIKVTYAPIHFVYDGKEYAPPEDQRGFIYKGSTYVPMHFITYMLNKGIHWNGDTYTVTVSAPDQGESILIDEYNLNTRVRNSEITKVNTANLTSTSIDVSFRKVTYIFNYEGKEPPAELPGMIYNSRTYVPMRFFSNLLNIVIDWDPETYSVIAQSEVYVEELKKIEEETGEAIDPKLLLPGVISGGGGTPSYNSIKVAADTQIASLKGQAQDYYFSLLLQYNAASEEDKPALIAGGRSKLADFDATFDSIISTLRTDLSTYGYSTSLADDYEVEYAESIIGD